MKRIQFILCLLLIGCAADQRNNLNVEPSAASNVPVAGQETHGGDLAVAMLRSAMMRKEFPNLETSQRLGQLMTMPATSVAKNLEDPLLELRNGVWEVNRTRVMSIDMGQIPLEIFHNLAPGTLFLESQKVYPHWAGDLMTPERFREVALRLFGRVRHCMNIPMGIDFLFPSFSESDIFDVPIEFTDEPLIDQKLRRPVDIGVTTGKELKILINRERAKEWTVGNYGTDYLAFHEFAHVFLKKAGRSDSDHVFASMFFYQCSSLSLRYNIRAQYEANFPEIFK